MNILGFNFTRRNYMLYFGYHDVGGGGHGLVEVLLRHPVLKISGLVRLPGANKSNIGAQCFFKNIIFTVDNLYFLSFGNHSTG
jgi:hypothetical protein